MTQKTLEDWILTIQKLQTKWNPEGQILPDETIESAIKVVKLLNSELNVLPVLAERYINTVKIEYNIKHFRILIAAKNKVLATKIEGYLILEDTDKASSFYDELVSIYKALKLDKKQKSRNKK